MNPHQQRPGSEIDMVCTGGHRAVASACPKMGHTFHLWKQLAPDGVIPGVLHSPPTDDGERRGGIWTADGSDPWVLCTNSQARRARRRRNRVRLPERGTRRSAEPADLDLSGWPVRIPGLFPGPRCYPGKPTPSAVTTPSESCARAALSGRERYCFRLRATPQIRARQKAMTLQALSGVVATPWEPLGPTGVITPAYGLVTGRISALALDPADATGNRLYVGTTGGGVWVSQDAGTSDPANVAFTP